MPREPFVRTGSVGVVVGATLSDVPDLGAVGGRFCAGGWRAGWSPDALRGLGGAAWGRCYLRCPARCCGQAPTWGAPVGGERMRDAVAYLSRRRSDGPPKSVTRRVFCGWLQRDPQAEEPESPAVAVAHGHW
jgi:hypothetical protein